MTRLPVATRRSLIGAGLGLPGLAFIADALAKPPEPPPPPPEPPEAPLIGPIQPLGRLLGRWTGQGSDQIGFYSIDRTYSSVLNGRFLMVRDLVIYPSQAANQSGEVHSSCGLFGSDNARHVATLRQFDSDGVVRQCVLKGGDLSADRLEFESEFIENLPLGYRVRETYVLLGPDALQHVYEVAQPGQDQFGVYSDVRLVRA